MRVERRFLVAGLALLTGAGAQLSGVAPRTQQIRMANNEAAVIADLRDIVAATQAYKASNGAWPTSLSCMGAPAVECSGGTLGFPAGTPAFLDPLRGATPGMEGVLSDYSFVSHSYRFTYVGGGVAGGFYDYGVRTFTISAEPIISGVSGMRFFGTDETGIICAQTSAAFPNDGISLPRDCARL